MKVYLAAPYAARPIAADYAAQLTRIGFTVTSRWMQEPYEITDDTVDAAPGLDDATVSGHASDDLYDVSRADLFTEKAAGAGSRSGGRHVETGYFICNKGTTGLIVVGEPENIFHRMAGVTVVPDWHEAVLEVSARLVGHERSMPQELVR